MPVPRLSMRLRACFAVHMQACAPSSERAGTPCCNISPSAATAKERGSGAAARTSVAASCGGLSTDAARLLLNARPNDFDLQSLRSFFAHNEPVTSKQCSNTSWGHAGPLVVKSVQVGNELQVRCVRHLVSPDWPRSNSLHVDARNVRCKSGGAILASRWVDVGRCGITLPGIRCVAWLSPRSGRGRWAAG